MLKFRSCVDRFSLFSIYHLFLSVSEGRINHNVQTHGLLLFSTSRGV
jgi:hypothetical protein